MLRLITGAPGCGKTTSIINKLAKEYFLRNIWVAEPFQSIVFDKSSKNSNQLIKFVNWATALGVNEDGEDGLVKYKDEDILVIDEFHLLYSSEYRSFKYNNVKSIIAKYKNVVIITATPNEIIREINELRIDCTHTNVPKRLRRDNIKINLYDTHISKYLNSVNIRDYSILNVNNIKQLYSICRHWNGVTSGTLGSSVLIRSYFSELNNFVFSPNYINDIRECDGFVANKDVFIGTVALGQGIDKDLKRYTVTDTRVIADSFEEYFDIKKTSIPEEIQEETILFDANSYKIDKPDYALYEYLVQNIIQGDRYRYDTNLNIDVLYSLNAGENWDAFIGELNSYMRYVYGDDINLEINIAEFEEFPANNVITNYKYKDFKVCLDHYNINHKENKKGLNTRFEEILKALLDDSSNVFKRRNGAIKTASKIAGDLFEKFAVDDSFIGDKTVRYYKVLKVIPKFIEFLKSEELTIKYIADRINDKLPDELFKKEKGLEHLSEEDLRTEAIKELGVFVETLFIMTIKLFGYNLNFADELFKRGGNDGTICSRKLRGLMICKDYDIKGAHIAAIVKAFKPDYDVKKLIDETDIYDLTDLIEMDRIVNILLTFKGYEDLTYEGLLELYKNDRGIVKQVLIACINSLQKDDRKELIAEYLVKKFNITVSPQEWKELEDKIKNVFIKEEKANKKIGYLNGIYHENMWLGHINKVPELFRIADGFATILDEGNADAIKEEIEIKHKIKMSEEPIKKIAGFNYKNFNNFYNEVEDATEDEMRTYIKANIKSVFYSLATFGTFISKGRCKGKAIGKAIGKTVNEKKYACVKSVIVGDVEYINGEIYNFGKDFLKTVGSKNRGRFKQIK